MPTPRASFYSGHAALCPGVASSGSLTKYQSSWLFLLPKGKSTHFPNDIRCLLQVAGTPVRSRKMRAAWFPEGHFQFPIRFLARFLVQSPANAQCPRMGENLPREVA